MPKTRGQKKEKAVNKSKTFIIQKKPNKYKYFIAADLIYNRILFVRLVFFQH